MGKKKKSWKISDYYLRGGGGDEGEWQGFAFCKKHISSLGLSVLHEKKKKWPEVHVLFNDIHT